MPDSAKFCPSCGVKVVSPVSDPILSAEPAVPAQNDVFPTPPQHPMYQQSQQDQQNFSYAQNTSAPNGQMNNANICNYYVQMLAKAGRSGVFLAGIIMCIISASLNFFTTVLRSSGSSLDQIFRLLYSLDLDDFFDYYRIYSLYNTLNRLATITALTGLIFSVLIIIGLFMARSGAMTHNLPRARSGLTMIKVLTIINLVGASLILLPLLFMVIVLFIGLAAVGEAEGVAIGLMLFIIFAAVAAVVIMFYVFTLRALGTASAITSMSPAYIPRIRRIPTGCGVFMIVFGVLCLNVATVLFGITLYSFAKDIERLPFTVR